jgi:hypothetical protein
MINILLYQNFAAHMLGKVIAKKGVNPTHGIYLLTIVMGYFEYIRQFLNKILRYE